METVWVRSKEGIRQGGWVTPAATGFCMMHVHWGSLAMSPSFAIWFLWVEQTAQLEHSLFKKKWLEWSLIALRFTWQCCSFLQSPEIFRSRCVPRQQPLIKTSLGIKKLSPLLFFFFLSSFLFFLLSSFLFFFFLTGSPSWEKLFHSCLLSFRGVYNWSQEMCGI